MKPKYLLLCLLLSVFTLNAKENDFDLKKKQHLLFFCRRVQHVRCKIYE